MIGTTSRKPRLDGIGYDDLVIGGIANDKIFKTIDLYFSGDITKDEALKRLKYEKPNNQYCCRTQNAIDLLSFHTSEDISR